MLTANISVLSRSLDLDRMMQAVLEGPCFEATLNQACLQLDRLRRRLPPDLWKTAAEEFQRHPLHRWFCECPFHRRAFRKPRGYAGDAPMLDFIYRLTPPPEDTTMFGRRFLHWTLKSASCRSVRARKNLLAALMDDAAAAVAQPRILSVACGHLREAIQSRALLRREIGEILAFDQDPESLDVIRREYGNLAVTPVQGSVRGLLSGKESFADLDLIYSAGLYDYLADSTATRLNQLLFAMLRPGGKLVIANFAPNLPDIGFMEASMDWWLIYRDEDACERLLQTIDPRHPRQFFRDGPGNIVFAEVTKRP